MYRVPVLVIAHLFIVTTRLQARVRVREYTWLDRVRQINAQPVAELEQDTIAELMHRDPESVRLRLERYLLVT